MIERYLLQVIAVLIIGELIDSLVAKRDHAVLNRYSLSKLINSIVYGYFLLIIPMIIFGIILPEYKLMKHYVYLYFGLAMILTLRKFVTTSLKLRKYKTDVNYTNFQKWLYTVILINFIGYFILLVSIPERGWDALNIYLPNGFIFYFQDRVFAGFNPFSFFPTFKPPLNTLLITYSWYVARGMYAYLHSFVFLLGTISVTYEVTYLLTGDKTKSLISSIIMLILPFTFFLVLEYALYQEIPLLFFSSASFYYILQMSIKTQNHPNYNLFKLGFILSFSLAVLTKVSGFAIIFIVLLTLDFSGRMKYFQLSVLVLIGIYLIQRAAFEVYIGFSLVILLILIYLFRKISNDQSGITISINELVKISILPLIVGVLWIIFSLQISQVGQFLVDRYIYSGASTLRFNFPAFPASQIHIENGMRASFFATVFFILTGSSFAPNLIFFKLDGLRKSKKNQFLIRWLSGYILVVFGYYAHISARYLVPLMVPLSILIGISISDFLDKFKLNDVRKAAIMSIIIVTTYLFYVPVLPVYTLMDGIYLIYYHYHANQVAIISILTMITVFYFKLATSKVNKMKSKRTFYQLFLLLTIIPTIFLPIGVSIYASQDPDLTTDNISSFYYRQNYQDLVTYIDRVSLNETDLIISVNIPGLGYFTRQPTLDLFLLQNNGGIDYNFKEQTQEEAGDFIQNIEITSSFSLYARMIIVQNSSHYFFEDFERDFSNLSIIQLTNLDAFQLSYFNDEFRVFFLINSTILPSVTNN